MFPVLPLAEEHDGMLGDSGAQGVAVTLLVIPAEIVSTEMATDLGFLQSHPELLSG